MSLLGRLSVVGAAPPPAGTPLEGVFRGAVGERTLPVVCRNLGIPCGLESQILARQIQAAHQVREILRGVEAIPLKGLYLAHRLYPSPALRDMGDVDLLVRRREVPAADGTLRALGYVPDRGAARAAAGGGEFLNSVLYAREGSFPVHLHWDLANASLPHFMVRIDAEEVWREARGGEMARHHLVVTLCEHALKHSFEALVYLTDIELASRGVDWGLAAEVSRRWGLERPVRWALVLLRDLMEVESPGLGRLAAGPPGWGERVFLRAARRRWRAGLSALGYLSMARGAGAKARFVREALFPGRRQSEGFTSRSPWARLGRAASLLWQGVRERA